MIDPNSTESAAKLLRFAEKMAESEHAEEFRHVIDVVISLREKISDLESELKQRPHQEEYRKLYKEKEQWRAGALKIKKQLELEKEQNEQLKKGALLLAENLIKEQESTLKLRKQIEAEQESTRQANNKKRAAQLENDNLNRMLEVIHEERKAAQRTIARLGGGE